MSLLVLEQVGAGWRLEPPASMLTRIRAAGFSGRVYTWEWRRGGFDVRVGRADLRVTKSRVRVQGVYA